MPHVEKRTGNIVIRIVYDGAPEAGKTTNLLKLVEAMPMQRRGKLVSPESQTRRTEFFDWVTFTGGWVDGRRLRCQLVSVPGQPSLLRRRRYLIDSADAVVFVADSRRESLEDSRRAFELMRAAVERRGGDVPAGVMLQANKQDLGEALSPLEVAESMGAGRDVPVLAAEAIHGVGVMQTFIAAARLGTIRVRDLLTSVGWDELGGQAESSESLLEELKALEEDLLEREIETSMQPRGLQQRGPIVLPELLDDEPDTAPAAPTRLTVTFSNEDDPELAEPPAEEPSTSGSVEPPPGERSASEPAEPPPEEPSASEPAEPPPVERSASEPAEPPPEERSVSEPAEAPPPEPTSPEPVDLAPEDSEPVATEPAPTEPAPTEPAPSEPAPSEPAPSEPAPSDPAPSVSPPGWPPSTPPVPLASANEPPRTGTESTAPAGAEPAPVAPGPPPPLPRGEGLIAGHVWPLVEGRAILAELLGGQVGYASAPAPWAPPGFHEAGVHDAGALRWRMHTGERWCFTEAQEAKLALITLVRQLRSLEPYLPPGRALSLSDADGAFRIWMVTDATPTLREALRETAGDADDTAAGVREALRMARELGEVRLGGAALDRIGISRGRAHVLGLPGSSGRPLSELGDELRALMRAEGIDPRLQAGVHEALEEANE